MFGRRWQNPDLFCHFWEIMHHGQTGNTTAKFHISLQRGRIASQFLHWKFHAKNSQFFALDRQKLAKSAKRTEFWQRGPNMPILSIFGCQVRKNVKFFTQSLNAKTDRLSFLFVMICETWLGHYLFGCDMSFTKVIKRAGFYKSKYMPIFAQIWPFLHIFQMAGRPAIFEINSWK